MQKTINHILLFVALVCLLVGISPVTAAGAATLRLIPVGHTVEVGQSFSVGTTIIPGGSSIDTVRAELSYTPGIITATTASLAGPLTSASPGNSLSPAGHISWGGFTVGSPVSTTTAFTRFNFTANQVGTATISLLPGTRLINEGDEVGDPSGYNQVTVTVVPSSKTPAQLLGLTSPTHPDSAKWYQSDTVSLRWDGAADAKFFGQLDGNPDTTPTESIVGTARNYKNVKSGIWYFHLLPEGAEASTAAHFKLQIDNVKPNTVEPYLDITNKQSLTVRFATTDYHSGIATYDIDVNSVVTENVTSPFALSGLNIGANRVTVTAFDNAGNSRTGWVKFTLDPDGTIHDIQTSASGATICDLAPGICTIPTWMYLFLFITLGGALIYLLRTRTGILKVKTITKTNFGTISKTTTKTDPKTGKHLTTKTVTKTDMRDVVETDSGALTPDKLEEIHKSSEKKKND